MGTYMVERYLPEISEEELRAAIGRVQAVAAQMQAEGLALRARGPVLLLPVCRAVRGGGARGKRAGGVSTRAHRPGGAHPT